MTKPAAKGELAAGFWNRELDMDVSEFKNYSV